MDQGQGGALYTSRGVAIKRTRGGIRVMGTFN